MYVCVCGIYNVYILHIYALHIFILHTYAIYILNICVYTYVCNIYIYVCTTYIHYIHINKVNLTNVVEINLKALFSIATTSQCREERFSFPGIAPLYLWYEPYRAIGEHSTSTWSPSTTVANFTYIHIKVSKVGERRRGRSEGCLFDSYYTKIYGKAPFLSLNCSTLPLILTMLSVKQGSINYYFLSLWYDSTWRLKPGH